MTDKETPPSDEKLHKLECAKCNRTDIQMITSVEMARVRTLSIADGKLVIDSEVEDEPVTEETNEIFQCRDCAHSWPIPRWVLNNAEWR